MKIELMFLDKELYKDGGLYPMYQTPGSAALDLVSAVNVRLRPGEAVLVKTGLAVWAGSEAYHCAQDKQSCQTQVAALIFPRSGLGHNQGLVLGNGLGVIDEDYQGELMISALNRTREKVIVIKRGQRFAQMLFIPIIKAEFTVVNAFSDKTERASGGFGSTGQ